MAARLVLADVACWVLKSARPPEQIVPAWSAGQEHVLRRCLHRSYRVGLMAPGQRCLLWVSGRDRPGVHALGALATAVQDDGSGDVEVDVRLRLLAEPVARADLVADPASAGAEVVRFPAGSNPSYLTAGQWDAVRRRLPPAAPRGGA